MITLSSLMNSSRPFKRVKRVGRGPGSGRGKTCCRGEKGAGSRAGYKRRWGYEGGQMRMFAKMPIRGFNNKRFRRAFDIVNLQQINEMFQDGEVVTAQSLADRGFLSGTTYGLKILGEGKLTKKVTIEAAALSSSARDKLQQSKVQFTIV